MPPTTKTSRQVDTRAIQDYLASTSDAPLSPASTARIATACASGHASLAQLVDESLFDTEPANLDTALDALSADGSA